MRRALLYITALLALSACAFGQAASSDTRTLQALLSEVRALRQELRASLNRTQSMQILLARFQVQEGVVTKATRLGKRSDEQTRTIDLTPTGLLMEGHFTSSSSAA